MTEDAAKVVRVDTTSVQDVVRAAAAAATSAVANARPEVEPLFTLIAHPFLSDPIFIAVAAGLVILIVVYTLFNGKSAVRRKGGVPTVLFVGPPDAGKTSLFVKLAQDTRPQTHTSLVSSTATINVDENKQVRLVDLPGHARLRDEVAHHASKADAVVFVLDIVALVRNASSVAEEIPPILTALAGAASRRSPTSPPSRLLILAHKSDLLSSSTSATASPPDINRQIRSTGIERARSILSREMDRLKAARGAGGVGGRIEGMAKVSSSSGRGWWAKLFGGGGGGGEIGGEGSGEDDESLIWGGAGTFNWADVEGVEVEWAVSALGSATPFSSVEESGDGLDDLIAFLSDI